MQSGKGHALEDVASAQGMRWVVADGWQQGRGAWGGLVVAAVVRAAQAAEASAGSPGRCVRSVTAQIVAPVVTGEAKVSVQQVRRGSSTSTWTVDVDCAGSTAVSAAVVFGDDRTGEPIPGKPRTAPQAPSWNNVAEVDLPPSVAPAFLQHLRIWPVSGMPYSGEDEDIVMWLSYRTGLFDAASLLAIVDGPWPTPLVRVREPRPMATLSFLATLLVDPQSIDPDAPLLFRAQLLGEMAGYATERRELWTADGRLAVENLQLIAVIR